MSTPTTQLYLRFRAQSRRDNGNAIENKMRSTHWDPDDFVGNLYTDRIDNIHAIVREHLGRAIVEKPISAERLICEIRLYMERLNKNITSKWYRITCSSKQLILQEYIENNKKWITTITSFVEANTEDDHHDRKDISTRLCEQIDILLPFPTSYNVTNLLDSLAPKKTKVSSIKKNKGASVKNEVTKLRRQLSKITTGLNDAKKLIAKWASDETPVISNVATIAEENSHDEDEDLSESEEELSSGEMTPNDLSEAEQHSGSD